MASRLDNFLVVPTDRFGEKMRDQVEQRLKFLTAGGPMDKNTDVMDEVLTELKSEGLYYESEKTMKRQ
jgi:nucleolar protein 56